MKLEQKTVGVLKNFSHINPSMLFKEGNVLATMSPTRSILVKAKVPNEFDKRFAIYNLSSFLGTLSIMNDPSLEFGSSYVKIEIGRAHV